MRNTFVRTGFLLAAFLCFTEGAHAVVLNVGDTARVDYSPGALGPGTPPFAFIALGFNFDASDAFGPNESLSYKVYAPDNTLLGEGSTDAGNSVYTSGLFAALTLSVFPSSPLGVTSFYATVTATLGSFDLTGGQADLYNFSGGVSQFASVGVVAAAVPEPGGWAMLALGFGGLSLARVLKRAEGRALN